MRECLSLSAAVDALGKEQLHSRAARLAKTAKENVSDVAQVSRLVDEMTPMHLSVSARRALRAVQWALEHPNEGSAVS